MENWREAVKADAITRRQLACLKFQQFTDGRLDQRVQISGASHAVGVSERTLRTYCIQQLGMTPKKYEYLQRMYQANQALGQADPAMITVTKVALDCGFEHLGWFSVGYKQIFGEAPSVTLRKGKVRRRRSPGPDRGR
jgi:transcriptional regulator GlxA family with amidase domain